MSWYENGVQNHNVKRGNECFSKGGTVEIFGNNLDISHNSFPAEIKSRLKSGKYKTIFPFVFYGCETWLPILSEENRLRGLRKIFVSKRIYAIGEWRILHNEQGHELYSSPDIIQVIKSWRMRWVGRPEGKRALRISRCRQEDNIEMDLQEVRWGHRPEWSGLGRGQVLCECGNKPSGSMNCREFLV